jgi:hypothetical protein
MTSWINKPSPGASLEQWHRDAAERDAAYLAEGPVDMTETDDSPWRGVLPETPAAYRLPVDDSPFENPRPGPPWSGPVGAFFEEPAPRHAADQVTGVADYRGSSPWCIGCAMHHEPPLHDPDDDVGCQQIIWTGTGSARCGAETPCPLHDASIEGDDADEV